MRTAARALLVTFSCVAAIAACGADEAAPGVGSSGTSATSSSSSSGGADASTTSSGAPADADAPTGRDVPIGMGGPSASSSGTPDAGPSLACLVEPSQPLTLSTCKGGRTSFVPQGTIPLGSYELTGYWSCDGFTKVAGNARIYVENGITGMRYQRANVSGDAGAAPGNPVYGTWQLTVTAGHVTRQDVCTMSMEEPPESGTFRFQNGELFFAFGDHDERWLRVDDE